MDMLSKNVFVYLSRSGEIDLELEDDGRTVKGYNLVNGTFCSQTGVPSS